MEKETLELKLLTKEKELKSKQSPIHNQETQLPQKMSMDFDERYERRSKASTSSLDGRKSDKSSDYGDKEESPIIPTKSTTLKFDNSSLTTTPVPESIKDENNQIKMREALSYRRDTDSVRSSYLDITPSRLTTPTPPTQPIGVESNKGYSNLQERLQRQQELLLRLQMQHNSTLRENQLLTEMLRKKENGVHLEMSNPDLNSVLDEQLRKKDRLLQENEELLRSRRRLMHMTPDVEYDILY
eukprot:NODE_3713_length_1301_cov_35.827674_g3168_i1.p1 GENE.NODE_3713_length_1301_cov_35.827674_g3168_i1~~NODE_3713_length_1301_cov_35.827674_g3168_i1.p1  ORF type:complete len:242 (-),score=63.06 NODE_3713_length_1301_cov_35.827674_g3168_i1:10-735(-)